MVAAAALALALFGLFATEIADTDFWWHLKTGEHIVETGSLPVPDSFAYTTYSREESYPGEADVRYFNLTHEWLAQALWFVLYRLGGFPAAVLWKGLLLAFFCLAAGWVALRRTASAAAGLFAATAGAPLALLFAADRPALLTFAFVAAFVVILEGRLENRLATPWLAALPVLSLIWANSHGGFFLGWVILGAYGLESFRLPRPRRAALWAAAAASVLISGLNPSGFGVFEILAAYRASFLQQTLIEWKPLPPWGPPYVVQAALYVTFAVMLLKGRRTPIRDWALLVAFGAAAFLAARNVVFLAFFVPFLLAAHVPRGRVWALVPPRAATIATFAVAIAMAGWAAARGRFFQLGVAEWKFPVEAARFLKENDVQGRLFNTYEFGGYLIWALGPERPVFIDGRALNEAVYRDYRKILYQQNPGLLDRYGIDVVLMNSYEFVSGVMYPLAPALADPANRRWALVHEDAQALVFVRETPENADWIARRGLEKARVLDHWAESCAVYVAHSPDLANCARTAAEMLARAGDRERAARMLEVFRGGAP